MKTLWLGKERGALTDWVTQMWVRLTGRTLDLAGHPWLVGPIGETTGIGRDFFDRMAEERGYVVDEGRGSRGLIALATLDGAAFDAGRVHQGVRTFYEETSEYELESWAEWCGAFSPFGLLLGWIFARRLQQLNVPVHPLDTSRGTESRVIRLVDPSTGSPVLTAWVRTLRKTGNVLYAGTYSTAVVPGHPSACVKVVFPLPNGNAIVIMWPKANDDGSLTITSSGRRFGDPGFYFTVCRRDGKAAVRYVRTMRESIHVYAGDEPGEVRADHVLAIWGATFLRLHYRLRRRSVPAG